MTITAKTKVVILIGDPVGHSLSPTMHNAWIADHGLNAVFVAAPLRGEEPEAAIRAMRSLGLAGLNITVPHKEAAARAVGAAGAAVNVVRWDDAGRADATSTDGPGFLAALTEAAPDWRDTVRRVLILGAGGSAQSVAESLSPHAETICFANRTQERASTAAAKLSNGATLAWNELDRGFAEADLIVQATTLGMTGQPQHEWPVARCRPSTIVADLVYRPLETGLLHSARARGLRAVDGLAMLIHQGVLAFEFWFGVRPDAAKARERLMAALV